MFNLSFTACSFYFQKLHSRNINNICYLNQNFEYANEASGESGVIQIKDLLTSFFEEYKATVNDTDNQKTFRCEFNDSFSGESNNFCYIYCY